MIELITAAILALAGDLPHIRDHYAGPDTRAGDIAALIVDAGRSTGVDAALIAALAYHESRYRDDAVSPTGAAGLLQLSTSSWGRDPLRLCIRYPEHCTWWLLRGGARVLAHYQRRCGTDVRAVTAYRTGRCGPAGPRAREVVVLAARIRSGGVR